MMACDCRQCRIKNAAFGEGATTEAARVEGLTSLCTVLGAALGMYFDESSVQQAFLQILDGRDQVIERDDGRVGHA